MYISENIRGPNKNHWMSDTLAFDALLKRWSQGDRAALDQLLTNLERYDARLPARCG
jgi:hypothetical protein